MPDPTAPLARLIAIVARLRDPVFGCEWDRAQSFATIAPYTIEEAYEVADAIARNDLAAIRDELGDLLLQIVFHTRIAEESGAFSLADVATGIANKMEARHPHIFASDIAAKAPEAVRAQWEAIKASERAAAGVMGALDGVALALPALLRAEKLQQRAARVGFDWPDTAGPAAKLVEETAELVAASAAERAEEAGDLLFAAVNLVRAYGIAPETALRAGNAKFERRFRAMEAMAAARGVEFGALTLAGQEELWVAVKAAETSTGGTADPSPTPLP